MHAITRYYLFINKMIKPAEVKKNIALNIVTSKKQGMHSRYRLYITLRQMKTLLIVLVSSLFRSLCPFDQTLSLKQIENRSLVFS